MAKESKKLTTKKNNGVFMILCRTPKSPPRKVRTMREGLVESGQFRAQI